VATAAPAASSAPTTQPRATASAAPVASAEPAPNTNPCRWFAFGFDSSVTSTKSRFVAHAHGDLDGDGITSTFEVRGHYEEGDPNGAVLEPGMYVNDEVE
jgi:hypothetical protein